MENSRESVPLVRRSSFVSTVAVGAFVFAVWSLFSDIIGITSYINYTNDPMLSQALRYMESQSPHQAFQMYSEWYVPLTTASLVIDVLTLIASVGLFRRHERSRQLFVYLVGVVWVLQTATSVSGLISLGAASQSTGQASMINTLASLYSVAIGLWCIISAAISITIIVKLRSGPVRREFTIPPANESGVSSPRSAS